MKKFLLFVFAVFLLIGNLFSQQDIVVVNNYKSAFRHAYIANPAVPLGLLEAVSYTNTRLTHITSDEPESCAGLPKTFGLMGLVENGKNYFKNNLLIVAALSGVDVELIKSDPAVHLMAYAKAYSKLLSQMRIQGNNVEDHSAVILALTEFPNNVTDAGNDFAANSFLYSVFSFMNDIEFANRFDFPARNIDMPQFFGVNNFQVLSSSSLRLAPDSIISGNGTHYQSQSILAICPDYNVPHCSWTASTNYSSRSGTAISAVVMHTVQGSYSGCISWFQNTSSNASTQYVVRSSDGQLCQMVLEANKAWHVTTENPYTIGYEHEGYVTNPAWYTVAMYQSSANLTRDICNAYGINPLRTFFQDTLDNGTAMDYGLHSLGGESGCVKVRGHQHFINQTHTDPAQYWTWDYYYKLINNNPTITTLNAASGNFYDTGGAGANYANDERKLWLIQPAGATSVTLNFSSFAVEANYDFMYIYDGTSVFSPKIGRFNTLSPGTVTSSGGAMLVEFRSDCSTTGAGWAATWTSAVADNTPPSTAITSPGTWKTADFTATFTDADNIGGTGIEKRYYQVLENQGAEWRANANRGYFADNFDVAIHPDWTVFNGSWSINSGSLYQSDTTISNTNIYAALNQNLSNRALYNFNMKLDGNVTNKRAGFHFYCDSANTADRRNSYFIFFRVATSQLEFYKDSNNTYYQKKIITGITTNMYQWYDIKVIHDHITGKIDVYRDNIFLGSWTDPVPWTTNGNYISFRSGNCKMNIGEIKVYRSRNPSTTVGVGNLISKDIRYENPNPTTNGAKIKSIVNDSAGNISAIAFHGLNVDYTPPAFIATVNDGSGADLDITNVNSSLSANWTASTDPNSGIASYWYAIGTTAGDSNIVGWTNNALNVSFIHSGLSLGSGMTYYVSIRAYNAAGLKSGITSSDGITVASSTLAGFSASSTQICAGDTINYTNSSSNALGYLWNFSGGNPSSSTLANPVVVYSTPGVYDVTLNAYGIIDTATINQTSYINVNPLPVAAFETFDTLLYLPGALALFTNNSMNATSFLWNFGDGVTSTDQNPWHIYDTVGVYTVTLVCYNSLCGNDTIIMDSLINVGWQTGVADNFNSSVFLYPSPVSHTANICFHSDEPGSIVLSLIDPAGREIKLWSGNTQTKAQIFVLDADALNLAEGMYTLKLNTKSKVYSSSFIRIR
ncbi:MAG: N-acetylmuramoyl-L-alanine amidase [Bacteroidota bacterium]